MTDVMTRRQRSRLMSAVKRQGNRTTEVALARILRALRLRGWRRQAELPGTPDFVFPMQRAALFADGCFWHGCPRHYSRPATNAEYWRWKIEDNRRRDRRVARRLRKLGWSVWRISECRIREGRLPAGLIATLRGGKTDAHESTDVISAAGGRATP